MRQLDLTVFTGALQEVTVHEFHTGRLQSGLYQIRYQGYGLIQIVIYRGYVHFVRRQRQQLQGRLANNAQRAFRTHDQLFQAVPGAALFQTGTQGRNLSGRRYHFYGIHLVPGGAVAYRLVAAGVGCDVAADEAAFRAAGVARVQQTFCFGGHLDIDGTRTGFGYSIHGVFVDFNNLIHFFHVQHDTAQYGNRAVGNAGACAAGRYRNHKLVGQFHDCRNFFRAVDPDHNFRQVHQAGIRLFVRFKTVQGFCIRFYICPAYNLFQFFQQFRGNGIILCHTNAPLPTFCFSACITSRTPKNTTISFIINF